MKRKIWIDCDPGIDDAVAIALAAACRGELEILGISTVAGNLTIEQVTKNALKLTSFLGIPQVPVAKGSARPLVRQVAPAGNIHGSAGLGECQLPETEKQAVPMQGVVYLAECLKSLPAGEKATLVPIGPLTNIGLLLRMFPEVQERIEEICLMGGAAVGGNRTPTGEFNIWQDPEAAQIVFTSEIPIIMCGLDVTNHCGFTREQTQLLKQSENPVRRAIGEMVEFYFQYYANRGRLVAAIHDAVPITYLLHPEWFQARAMDVQVDCSECQNRGMTICDFRGNPKEEHPVKVLLNAEVEKVQAFWMERLGN